MQQEVFLVGSLQRINELLVVTGAERGYNQRLGFAAGEQGRTMGAWQNADFALDLAHIGQSTTVNT